MGFSHTALTPTRAASLFLCLLVCRLSFNLELRNLYWQCTTCAPSLAGGAAARRAPNACWRPCGGAFTNFEEATRLLGATVDVVGSQQCASMVVAKGSRSRLSLQGTIGS
jgi:hypothetical protein